MTNETSRDLPRPFMMGRDVIRDAYNQFQPNRFRYDYPRKSKMGYLKNGELDRDGFALPYELRGKLDAPLLTMDLPGGPGSTQNNYWKAKFDPAFYRVIVADWRGVGVSTPLGRTDENTTDRLVEDIEALRLSCAKTPDEKLVLRGGSWGMTVAIAYAAKYPQNTAGLVLGLPFLARASDSAWNYGPDGLALHYPEAYQDFIALAGGTTDVKAIMAAYNAALDSPDMEIRKQAYAAFTNWENGRNGEDAKASTDDSPSLPQRIARARLMVAYTLNDFYLGEEGIVPLLQKIPATVPVIVVGHSRDPLCAPDSLQTLMDGLPQAEYMIKEANFHWVSESAVDESRGFDNSFVEQAYPYACTRMGLKLRPLEPTPAVASRPAADVCLQKPVIA